MNGLLEANYRVEKSPPVLSRQLLFSNDLCKMSMVSRSSLFKVLTVEIQGFIFILISLQNL
jgi:hypothetical protein